MWPPCRWSVRSRVVGDRRPRSAELHSAVPRIWNLRGASQPEAPGRVGRPADCKSAIRRLELCVTGYGRFLDAPTGGRAVRVGDRLTCQHGLRFMQYSAISRVDWNRMIKAAPGNSPNSLHQKVRKAGLEPARLAALPTQSSATPRKTPSKHLVSRNSVPYSVPCLQGFCRVALLEARRLERQVGLYHPMTSSVASTPQATLVRALQLSGANVASEDPSAFSR